jgi:hypothetical protein
MRVELEDTVSRETGQRLLEYDAATDWLLLARVGEKDGDPGILQVINAKNGKTVKRLEVGVTPTALAVDGENIYITGFDSNTLTVINKGDFSLRTLACGRQPLKIALAGGAVFVINHGDNTLCEFRLETPKGTAAMKPEWRPRAHRIPFPGRPDQAVWCQGRLWIASHSADELLLFTFDPATTKFTLRHREKYPYGEPGFAGNNSSFFLRGQYGDGIYDLCRVRAGAGTSVWVSDFLSGKVFVFDGEK